MFRTSIPPISVVLKTNIFETTQSNEKKNDTNPITTAFYY